MTKQKRKSVAVENKTRRRLRFPSKWKANVKQAAHRSGQEYIKQSGEIVSARSMGFGCKEACRYKCHSKISEADRKLVYENFVKKAKMEGSKSVWEFIVRHVKESPRAVITNEDSERTCAVKYHFRHEGKEVRVCKDMFVKTFNISNTVIDTAFAKLGNRGAISPSKQGKHNKCGNAIPLSLKESVRHQIALFPKVDPHYVRSNSSREYLQDGKSIANMLRAYLKWMKDGRPVDDNGNLEVSDCGSRSDIAEEEEKDSENFAPIHRDNGNHEVNDDSSDCDLEEDEDIRSKKKDLEECVGKIIDGVKVATYRQYTDIFNSEFKGVYTCWTFKN